MIGFRNLIIRARKARAQRNYSEAASLYERALEIWPFAGAVHIQCGHMHKEAGNVEKAAAHYRRAKKLRPHDPDLALQLGHFYKVAGYRRAAELAYEEALRLRPGWTEPAKELDALPHKSDLSDAQDRLSALENTVKALLVENRRLLDDAYWHYQNQRRTMAWMALSGTAEMQARIVSMLRLLRPMKAVGVNKVRLGTAHDGGYVILDDFAGINTVLSFGIEHNADFDLAIADRVGHVLQFDHTIDTAPISDPRLIWTKRKISGQASETEESIVSIVDRLPGNGCAHDLILKLDIEHDEWPLFDATPREYLGRFRQIVGEFHGFDWFHDHYSGEQMVRVIEKLSKSHAVVHVHGTNHSGAANIAGVLVPFGLEITFANRSAYDLVETDETFPGPLDAPDDASRPDYVLGAFRF